MAPRRRSSESVQMLLKELAIRLEDQRAAEHVAVSAEIFRRGVHRDVGAEVERALKDRRPPGVVDGADRAAVVRDSRDRGDVETRSRGLDGVSTQMSFVFGRMRRRRRRGSSCRRARARRPTDRRRRATSLIVPKYASSGAMTCEPGPIAWISVIVAAEPDANAAALAPPSRCGETLLECRAIRVGVSRVQVAGAIGAVGFAKERCREVYGRRDGAGRGVELVAGVNGDGFETHCCS